MDFNTNFFKAINIELFAANLKKAKLSHTIFKSVDNIDEPYAQAAKLTEYGETVAGGSTAWKIMSTEARVQVLKEHFDLGEKYDPFYKLWGNAAFFLMCGEPSDHALTGQEAFSDWPLDRAKTVAALIPLVPDYEKIKELAALMDPFVIQILDGTANTREIIDAVEALRANTEFGTSK